MRVLGSGFFLPLFVLSLFVAPGCSRPVGDDDDDDASDEQLYWHDPDVGDDDDAADDDAADDDDDDDGGDGWPNCCDCVCEGCTAHVTCTPDCGATCYEECYSTCVEDPYCGGYVASSEC